MLSKTVIAYIQSLKDKKFRQKYQTFLVEGAKIAIELLKSDWEIENLYCTNAFQIEHQSLLNKKGISADIVETWELKKIANAVTTPDVVAVVKIQTSDLSVTASQWTLVLDGIQDPGNMGTILRTADWFGIRQVIASEDSVDIFNPKVVQSSMGSFLRIAINYTPLATFLSNQTLPIYGALLKGKNLEQVVFNQKGILIMGNEGNGIRSEIANFIQNPITIPKYGNSESLNVAVATGIICNAIASKTV